MAAAAPKKEEPQDQKEAPQGFALQSKPAWLTFVGRPDSGKSHAMRHIIQEHMRSSDPFHFGVVFVKTKFNGEWSKNKYNEDQDSPDFIDDKYVNPGFAKGETFTVEKLHAYIQRLERYTDDTGKKHPKNFVVLDDLQGLRNANDPLMQSVVASYRHTNSHFFISAQYLNVGTSTGEREVSVYNFLFCSDGHRSVKSWYEWFGQKCESFEEFKKLLEDVTDSDKHHVLLFLAGKNTKRESYFQWKAGEVDPNFKVLFPHDKKRLEAKEKQGV